MDINDIAEIVFDCTKLNTIKNTANNITVFHIFFILGCSPSSFGTFWFLYTIILS
jgi:hypothetical protein